MNRSTTSPYKGTSIRGTTSNAPQSLELLIKSLQRENNSLVEQVNILKSKSKKVNQLQGQIDMVLKHNSQLLIQNEKLSKLMSQKKSDLDHWKNKYESFAVNRNASSQLQNRKLITQIQKLKEQITDIQHIKNVQISDLKNQHHLEIQNIKRNHLGNNEKYQLEIRKFKEYLEKKDYEISDLNMKLVRLNKETDFEIGKLREEKQRLRSDLLYEQSQHKKEIDSLKGKFDYNFHSEMENLKKQHLNQIEALDYQNMKLKEVINSKNQEIEQIMNKHLKVKNNYEDSIDLLKKQCDDLKDKLFETERVSEIELANLRDKLEGIKESELTLLKNSHNNQLDLLNRQISKLQQIIEQRNDAIQQLAKQKNQTRLNLQAEISRVNAEFQAQIEENRDMAIQHDKTIRNNDLDLQSKNEEMKTIEDYLQLQVATLRNESQQYRTLLERKTQSLEKEQQEHYLTKKTLQNEVQTLKDKNVQLKDELQIETKRGGSQSEDLKRMSELKTNQLNNQIRGLTEQGAEKDKLIADLRQTIKLKEKEIKASEEKSGRLEDCEKELRRQAKENQARWTAKEAEYNTLIKNQIQNMDRTRKRETDELKSIQDNKINTLKHQIKELERLVESKNRFINDLKEKYEALVNKFEQIFAQRAAQKNLDIKVPGWIPDTLATKSLMDVFLKNKVLEYCS